MNRSASKRQHHEQSRKKRKHDQLQHAKELAKKPRSAFPRFLLIGAVVVILAFVMIVAFGR